MPYTEEALQHMIGRVQRVQDTLGRSILIENVSSYLEFAHSTISEWDFLVALASAAGCAILLDVNNVHVSARNHGFDARRYIDARPAALIGEIHLAGHSVDTWGGREIVVDTHSAPVSTDVWALYAHALDRLGPVPTLIDWDSELPALEVLLAEAAVAQRHLEATRALAA
jgi:uncharacterized protein (UPF0276 family)